MSSIVLSENVSYVALTFLAGAIIYCGAHESLEAQNPSTTSPAQQRPDARQEVNVNAPISSTEAWMFPILGSVVLLTLWLMLRYLNADIVRLIFAAYFTIAGVLSVWNVLLAITRATLSDSFWKRFKLHELPLQLPLFGRVFLRYRVPTVILAVVAVLPSILYISQRGPDGFEETPSHAILNDIIACSLAFGMLNVIRLDGFKTGCILLTGLFFYDIWWVFGTPVMVDVAKGLDAPMLILWPRSLLPGSGRGFMMLGLGDVVLPGAFVTTSLRFDQLRSSSSERAGLLTTPRSFPKPYFTTALVAYIIGLNITSIVVQWSEHPQPALLYLSPACIGAFFYTAWKTNELSQAWHWKHESKADSAHPARPDSEVTAIEADVPIASSIESLGESGSPPDARKRGAGLSPV